MSRIAKFFTSIFSATTVVAPSALTFKLSFGNYSNPPHSIMDVNSEWLQSNEPGTIDPSDPPGSEGNVVESPSPDDNLRSDPPSEEVLLPPNVDPKDPQENDALQPPDDNHENPIDNRQEQQDPPQQDEVQREPEPPAAPPEEKVPKEDEEEKQKSNDSEFKLQMPSFFGDLANLFGGHKEKVKKPEDPSSGDPEEQASDTPGDTPQSSSSDLPNQDNTLENPPDPGADTKSPDTAEKEDQSKGDNNPPQVDSISEENDQQLPKEPLDTEVPQPHTPPSDDNTLQEPGKEADPDGDATERTTEELPTSGSQTDPELKPGGPDSNGLEEDDPGATTEDKKSGPGTDDVPEDNELGQEDTERKGADTSDQDPGLSQNTDIQDPPQGPQEHVPSPGEEPDQLGSKDDKSEIPVPGSISETPGSDEEVLGPDGLPVSRDRVSDDGDGEDLTSLNSQPPEIGKANDSSLMKTQPEEDQGGEDGLDGAGAKEPQPADPAKQDLEGENSLQTPQGDIQDALDPQGGGSDLSNQKTPGSPELGDVDESSEDPESSTQTTDKAAATGKEDEGLTSDDLAMLQGKLSEDVQNSTDETEITGGGGDQVSKQEEKISQPGTDPLDTENKPGEVPPGPVDEHQDVNQIPDSGQGTLPTDSNVVEGDLGDGGREGEDGIPLDGDQTPQSLPGNDIVDQVPGPGESGPDTSDLVDNEDDVSLQGNGDDILDSGPNGDIDSGQITDIEDPSSGLGTEEEPGHGGEPDLSDQGLGQSNDLSGEPVEGEISGPTEDEAASRGELTDDHSNSQDDGLDPGNPDSGQERVDTEDPNSLEDTLDTGNEINDVDEIEDPLPADTDHQDVGNTIDNGPGEPESGDETDPTVTTTNDDLSDALDSTGDQSTEDTNHVDNDIQDDPTDDDIDQIDNSRSDDQDLLVSDDELSENHSLPPDAEDTDDDGAITHPVDDEEEGEEERVVIPLDELFGAIVKNLSKFANKVRRTTQVWYKTSGEQ